MTNQLRLWFAARSLRERRLLLIMAALLAITILWAGIIRPLSDAISTQHQRHTEAVLRLADTEARLKTLHDLQQDRSAPLDAPIDTVIRQRAEAAGFVLSNVTAQSGGRVQIAIPNARPGALFAWIADLEAAGILVDSIDITNNGDQTVSVQATLMKRGV